MVEAKMRFTLKTLAFMLVALLPGAAWSASFTATLDRDAITLGESATLSLAFEGAQPGSVPTPSVAGLQIIQAGTSQNMSWINGAMSSTVTVSFSVTPQREGEFTIPALTVDANGQQLSTAPLKLTVTRASAPSANAVNSGSEVAFLKFSLPKDRVFVGESVVGHLDLYLRDDVQNYGNFQLTGLPTDGFSAGKIVQGSNRRAQVGSRVYTVVPLSVPLTAVRAGALALGPFTASCIVVLPAQNQGGDPFFRQFFNQGEQKKVSLATETVSVESLPLPEQNQPANFTGAVGDFTMTATAGPTTVTVGDPITVRVQISGRGSLDGVTLPTQDAWQNFKTYPPTTKLATTDQFGFQGTKTFEQIISPLNNDVRELPALTFSFFNPEDGQYHTLTQPAMPLVVKAAGATPLPQIAANKPEEKPAQDILPIKENLGTLSQNKIPLVAQPAFLAAQAVPVLAFLGAFIWRKRADSLANNPRLRRQRAVAALVASGRDDLKKYAAANQSDEFFATLFRLLQEQLGERLDCPASAITENVVEENQVLRGAPEATRAGLREQFQLCNQARYAPVRGTGELNSVAAQFEKLIGELQNLKS
jgi:hypothetical protein